MYLRAASAAAAAADGGPANDDNEDAVEVLDSDGDSEEEVTDAPQSKQKEKVRH
jgi:hypothetical protein